MRSRRNPVRFAPEDRATSRGFKAEGSPRQRGDEAAAARQGRFQAVRQATWAAQACQATGWRVQTIVAVAIGGAS